MKSFSIPNDIRELSQQRASEFKKISGTLSPQRIEAGQIWSTRSKFEVGTDQIFETEEPRLIVILTVDSSVSSQFDVVSSSPISLELSMATKNDLLITNNNSPLGFDFLIEVWNETPVILAHLKQFLGKLGKAALAALDKLYKAQLRDEEIAEDLRGWVGADVFSKTDPRVEFQKSEIDAVKYLANAATAVLEMNEHGDLVEKVTETQPSSDFTISAPINTISQQSGCIIDLQLRRAKLSQFIPREAVAAAASVVEVERYILTPQDLKSGQFVFELLYTQRPPYSVYLKVHELPSGLLARKALVTITTTKGNILQSTLTELQIGMRINVGEDPSFQLSQNHKVTIEVIL